MRTAGPELLASVPDGHYRKGRLVYLMRAVSRFPRSPSISRPVTGRRRRYSVTPSSPCRDRRRGVPGKQESAVGLQYPPNLEQSRDEVRPHRHVVRRNDCIEGFIGEGKSVSASTLKGHAPFCDCLSTTPTRLSAHDRRGIDKVEVQIRPPLSKQLRKHARTTADLADLSRGPSRHDVGHLLLLGYSSSHEPAADTPKNTAGDEERIENRPRWSSLSECWRRGSVSHVASLLEY